MTLRIVVLPDPDGPTSAVKRASSDRRDVETQAAEVMIDFDDEAHA